MASIHDEALARGVHPECFKAGPNGGACKPCADIVMGIFSERYDGVDPEVVRSVITRDILAERCESD